MSPSITPKLEPITSGIHARMDTKEMKHRTTVVKATATLTFPFQVELEDGEDKKRILREEALAKISPPFNGWTLEVKED